MKVRFAVFALVFSVSLSTAARERADIPANTIWSFKDPGGRVLWEVCGGKQSTCTIVLAATN
ncbi:MAG: hypothetical protein RSD49_20280, partial [Hafnia sp.]